MPDVPWELLGKGGPWLLLGLAIMGVLRGWLVPSNTVSLLMQRAEDWKAAWQAAEEARRLQAEQLAQLLEYARTANAVLQSLPHAPNLPPALTDREPA